MNSKILFLCLTLVAQRAVAIHPESLVDLGCWSNPSQLPLIESLENTTKILDGNPELRYAPIQKCREAAKEAGYQFFALQKGACLSSSTAGDVYMLHGKSTTCPRNGTGNETAMQVYKIGNFGFVSVSSLGCWNRTSELTQFPEIEVDLVPFQVPVQDVVQRCGLVVSQLGWKAFTVSGGRCFASPNITERHLLPEGNVTELYKADGPSTLCSVDGIREATSTQRVYVINSVHPINLTTRGCWESPREQIDLGLFPLALRDAFSEVSTSPMLGCVEVARQMGNTKYVGFEDGRCVSPAEIEQAAFHVESTGCLSGGLGGLDAIQLYEMEFKFEGLPISKLGCWREVVNVTSLEGTSPLLLGNYHLREDALKKCAIVAYMRGFDVIALVDGGKCVSGYTLREEYKKNGPSFVCPQSGKGIENTMEVYELNVFDIVELNNLSCWREMSNYSIPSIEGTTGILDKSFGSIVIPTKPYTTRRFPIQKCLQATIELGYDIFALHNNGRCLTSPDARKTYRRYGKATTCNPQLGTGSISANQVYEIKSIKKVSLEKLGCWVDDLLIPSLEGLELVLTEEETPTNNKVKKCAKAAAKRGYTHFALKNGKCHSSRDAKDIYKKSGKSTLCPPTGLGGPFVREVYKIVVVNDKTF